MFRIFAGLVFSSILITTGCGENTNGTLALTVTSTDRTGGQFNVVALATYAPPAGKTATGTPITLTTSIRTLNGIPTIVNDTLYADPTGAVSKTLNITQTTQIIYVDITASTGGLVKSFSISVPSLAVLTTTPSTVIFPANSVTGAPLQVTVTGGILPFIASMDASHTNDISINVNGAMVTLIKRNNSGVNPIIGALLTITDNSGNSVTIPVGYN